MNYLLLKAEAVLCAIAPLLFLIYPSHDIIEHSTKQQSRLGLELHLAQIRKRSVKLPRAHLLAYPVSPFIRKRLARDHITGQIVSSGGDGAGCRQSDIAIWVCDTAIPERNRLFGDVKVEVVDCGGLIVARDIRRAVLKL